MTKVLVLYIFHIYNERVIQFINNCVFYDENVDFVIISNNDSTFESPKYVKQIYRNNIGYDFGGWSDVLLKDNLYKNYDQFIFVNSSVIGPFISVGYSYNWTRIYLDELKDNIKLFGSTINTIGDPYKAHVQSYIFAMDKDTVEYLIKCDIFSTNYAKTFEEAVWNKEVLMSRKIIENGWNIGSLLKHYNGVDFTFKNKKPAEYNLTFLGDIMYPLYRGIWWDEHDLVFIKGNRVSIHV